MVLDNHCSRVSADDTQSRLFSDRRASDDGFQEAVGKLRSRQLPNINFDERLL